MRRSRTFTLAISTGLELFWATQAKGSPHSSQLEPSFQLEWSWVSFGHPFGSSSIEWA